MADMVNISYGNAAATALLGYAVVFAGLILLMFVVMIMSRIMIGKTKKNGAAPAAAAPAESAGAKLAPGSAGELKIYDTDPKYAAMIMAITADKLGKPLNELRFISIKEEKNDEI